MAIGDTLPRTTIRSELVEPTMHFRWLDQDGRKTLQQMFAVKSFDENIRCVGERGDWRDVPTEKED